MKRMKRIIALVLTLTMLTVLFAACTLEPNDNGGKNNGDENEVEKEKALDISEYTIVRPDKAADNVISVTSFLKSEILLNTGAVLRVSADVDSQSEYEILIGETEKDASKAALKKLDDKKNKEAFIIDITENKIAIVGFSDEDTVLGVKHFINEYLITCNIH